MRHGGYFPRGIRAARRFVFSIQAIGALLLLCLPGCSPKSPAHGTAFLVALSTNDVSDLARDSTQLLHARQVLRKRLDTLGVNFSIEPAARERLLIKLPNMDNNTMDDTARNLISKPGLLEFRMVHTNSSAGIIEPGYEVLREKIALPNGQKQTSVWLVRRSPERGLTGKYIRRATVSRDPITKAPQINFEFDQTGAKLFEQITTEYQPAGGRFFQLAIVLDGELQAVPRIMAPISGGRGVISGKFTVREALALAAALENPLETPVIVVEERSF